MKNMVLFNPATSIRVGTTILNDLTKRFGGDPMAALSGYRWGQDLAQAKAGTCSYARQVIGAAFILETGLKPLQPSID